MTEFLLAAGSALWLGVLTSISPCPLATNIAAISYIGRRVDNTRHVLLAGLLYTIGRVVAYVGLAFLLVSTALSVPGVSQFLQKYMHLLLGPTLIIVGMFLVGLIEINIGGGGVSESVKQRVDRLGIWGALALGVLFALAFCPTSAALFFGNVMASLSAGSTILLPLLYGIGTALPVIGFAVLIAARLQEARGGIQCRKQNRTLGSPGNRWPGLGGRLLLDHTVSPVTKAAEERRCNCEQLDLNALGRKRPFAAAAVAFTALSSPSFDLASGASPASTSAVTWVALAVLP